MINSINANYNKFSSMIIVVIFVIMIFNYTFVFTLNLGGHIVLLDNGAISNDGVYI